MTSRVAQRLMTMTPAQVDTVIAVADDLADLGLHDRASPRDVDDLLDLVEQADATADELRLAIDKKLSSDVARVVATGNKMMRFLLFEELAEQIINMREHADGRPA